MVLSMIHNLFSPQCKNLNNDDDTYIGAQIHTCKCKEMNQNSWVCCKTATERANSGNHHQ